VSHQHNMSDTNNS